MAYVVTENCIACKYTDCVSVCPVDCFREGENMLVIDPDECIDCGVCEPSCPAHAIVPDTHADAAPWRAVNKEFASQWPRIVAAKEPLPSAEAFKGKAGKFAEFFQDRSTQISVDAD